MLKTMRMTCGSMKLRKQGHLRRAKVVFLTNSMLTTRKIANGSLGIITNVQDNNEIEVTFPTGEGIQVRVPALIMIKQT
jgi:hypothetical protein